MELSMPEPVTTIGLGAIAAYLGKDGLEKLLGPAAAYLGEEARDFVKARKDTIGKIFKNASDKAGEKLNRPGGVPPKVLKTIIDDGSFSTDTLSIEYLGGVLASSRTELGRDDRGARISKCIDRLSTYQLRMHFLLYGTIRNIFKGASLSMNMNDRKKMVVYIPMSSFIRAMDFSADEINQIAAIMGHTLFGLHNDGLIEQEFTFGRMEFMRERFADANEGGIICQPSAFGTELFLWAFGHSDKMPDYIFSEEFHPTVEGCPNFIEGVLPIRQLHAKSP